MDTRLDRGLVIYAGPSGEEKAANLRIGSVHEIYVHSRLTAQLFYKDKEVPRVQKVCVLHTCQCMSLA